MRARKHLDLHKALLFGLCTLPLLLILWRGIRGELGPNPVEVLTHETGDWALRLLLLTLAVTPLRQLTGQAVIIRFRRMLGLFAFFYASLHLMVYLWLDQSWGWSEIIDDVLRRPFILVGWLAFMLMVPLAITSTQAWMRRLGRGWKRLHRSVYAIAVLAVLHYVWLVKADLLEPAIYALILALLLVARLPWTRPRIWIGTSLRRSGPSARERGP